MPALGQDQTTAETPKRYHVRLRRELEAPPVWVHYASYLNIQEAAEAAMALPLDRTWMILYDPKEKP